MRYGYFDDANREYVITRPDTPLPWINYLGSQDFIGLISNTGGGYCFYRDARLRRVTRYRYNNVPLDYGGRYLYLRDRQTGDFWSPTWEPARHPLEDYSCRHGLGYTIIRSRTAGIDAVVRYFIPPDDPLEVWQLTLTNLDPDRERRLSVFSAVEFCLWDAQDDATNFQRNWNIGEVEVEGNIIYHKSEYRERRNHFAFLACSEDVAGFDTQREAFLGAHRGWDRPEAVEQGRCANSVAHGWAPIGSHQVEVSLGPGESHQIVFLLGYHENAANQKFDPPGSQCIDKTTVRPLIERYLRPETAEAAFAALRASWNELLSTFQIDTPDLHANRMIDAWNAYQCMITFNVARSASLFESGIGRGIGFRDSNQDLLGAVHMVPTRARQRLIDLASTQLESGGAYHQYQPLTKKGNDAIGGGFNDDPLWLILSAAAYLKETGDFSLLEEPVPYDSRPGSERPFYDHLQRSLRYTLERCGPHGLPLIGRADWNDCLNLNTFSEEPGQSFQTAPQREGSAAESVFIAGLFVLAAREMAALARWRGRNEEATEYAGHAATMAETVNRHGWDGDWFLRAYDAFGRKVGSHECEEGQIFIEAQGICVMAGIGLDATGMAGKALASVHERLATAHGIALHRPAYRGYRVHLGEISSYPPGYKENGGIFCHTNPWIMIAEAMARHGDQAYDYYLRINPSAREEMSDLHRCEPYVYAQMIAGPEAPSHGEAKNSWLTGTATWNYVALTQWILGIRPSYEGLLIDPVFPREWDGYTAARLFRGVRYRISVRREGGREGVSLLVDGKPVAGNVVPLFTAPHADVEVTALIGAKER